ncbi:MAG: hypothetical protein HFE63_08960 [Clostridiales bacterium]|nr:hypothetical protein [Clostridiales bacterium]
METMQEKYFAAANSAGGFVSWFDEIFSPDNIDRIYIIKGGSGTGKSTLMKRIAARGVELGCTCEYFYCSSDPYSLDGIILRGGKGMKYDSIAVIDGTAPHTRDPKLPGAAEEIVNLGEFWHTDALREHRGEIAKLCSAKSALFSQAYEYLFAAGELDRLLRQDAARFVLREKLESAVERLLTQFARSVHFSPNSKRREPIATTRPVSAISTSGLVSYDTYRELPGKIYAVADLMGSAPFLFDALIDTAKQMGLDTQRAPMPLDPKLSEALYLPELGLSIVNTPSLDESSCEFEKIINMARFIDRDSLEASDRQRRRMLSKCSRELLDGALAKLDEVKRIHADVEKIYIAAMDFEAVDSYAKGLIERIF